MPPKPIPNPLMVVLDVPETLRVVVDGAHANADFPKMPLDVPVAVSRLPAVVLPAIVAPPV